MGLLKHLLFWPVTGPSFLTRFSLEKVNESVRTELTDDSAVKRELLELQMELEMGAIGEEEYGDREADLMRRLREVRKWRRLYGLPTAGGVVRLAEEAGPGEAGAGKERGRAARSGGAEVEMRLGFDEE